MKIAIPVFRDRISPVFDWAARIVVIEMEGPREIRREELGFEVSSPAARVDRLVDLKIDLLLCGGISATLFALLQARGLRVVPWVAGQIEEVLVAYVAGRIPGESFAMPGCCGRRFGQKGRGQGMRRPNRKGGRGPRPSSS